MIVTKLKVLAAATVVAAGGATAGWAFLPAAMGQGVGPGIAGKPAPAAEPAPAKPEAPAASVPLSRTVNIDELGKLRAQLALREKELAELKNALKAATNNLTVEVEDLRVPLTFFPQSAPAQEASAKKAKEDAARQRAELAAELAKVEAAKAHAGLHDELKKTQFDLAKALAELDRLRAKSELPSPPALPAPTKPPLAAPAVRLPAPELPLGLPVDAAPAPKYTVELYPVGDLVAGGVEEHNGLMQLIAMAVPDEESNRTVVMLPQVNAFAMSLSAEGHARVTKLFEKLRKMKAEQGRALPPTQKK